MLTAANRLDVMEAAVEVMEDTENRVGCRDEVDSTRRLAQLACGAALSACSSIRPTKSVD